MTLTENEKVIIHLAIFELGSMIIKLGIRLDRHDLLGDSEEDNIKSNLAEVTHLISVIINASQSEITKAMEIHTKTLEIDGSFMDIIREEIAVS